MRKTTTRRAGTAGASKREAFTLVELLVVIGIIALLISILLPALNSARRSANAVKCAAALREIGNCFNMYAGEYRGYAPPARIDKYEYEGVFYDSTVNTDDFSSTPAKIGTNAYWFHFLAKYITKVRGASMSNADQSTSGQMQRTLIWGCTNFQPYSGGNNAVNIVGGVNRQYTGFGMNNWPSFRSDYPAAGTNFPPASEEFINTNASKPMPNTWYKLAQYTRPAERALAGDSMWWSLESRSAADEASITQHNYEFRASGMTSPGTTNADMYRHGKSPGIEVPGQDGTLKKNGGKVAYNVLYADNHVVTEVERRKIHQATRMRFPK